MSLLRLMRHSAITSTFNVYGASIREYGHIGQLTVLRCLLARGAAALNPS
jgi:hypothetical protein